ncbi:MAG: endonuclease/exonuclease/phosphatase family protein [Gammaproteobacteria bacterium]|nr:endonuclease/exonuclease/phosphatase family protein [Gammaproteobacteria bacterium]
MTEPKRVLGKILFWDEQLSSDDTVACGTCHIPAAGGSDPRLAPHPGPDGVFDTDDDTLGSFGIVRRNSLNQAVDDPIFGEGMQVTRRASPNIFMSMYAEDIFWDGRARTEFTDPINTGEVVVAIGAGLESQAVVPILSNVEMAREARDWASVTSKLADVVPLAVAARLPDDVAIALTANPSYPDLFAAAFGDGEITPARIGLAIATYERTLVPDQTPWDLFIAGDETAMTEQQTLGWIQFSDSTVCDNCHVPPEFTDHQFYNIGLRPAAEDSGRQDVTSAASDFGSFKTPTLRNVGLRKAQMHVGWITDTQDAVDFYNANSAVTRHAQFTQDQSGIPTTDPNQFVDYSTLSFFVADTSLQLPILDFFDNALTDPRVSTETFPFDRPLLSSEMLQVMTYNISATDWTAERADLVADVLRNQNADIVGLQEARSDQQDDLLARLGDIYQLETFASGSSSDPVLLKRSKFSVLESGATVVVPGCNTQGFVNYLVLEYVSSAERFILHNNHFCARLANFPAGEPTAVERNEAHAAAVIETLLLNQAAWDGAPAIVIGDLNSSATTDTMRFLLAGEPFSNGSTNVVELIDTWDAVFPNTSKPAPIDWVLTTGFASGITVLDAEVISNAQTAMASDHEPVVARIAIDTTPLNI